MKYLKLSIKQAGAELCQAQLSLSCVLKKVSGKKIYSKSGFNMKNFLVHILSIDLDLDDDFDVDHNIDLENDFDLDEYLNVDTDVVSNP